MKTLVGGELVGDAIDRLREASEVLIHAPIPARMADVDALIPLPSQRIDASLLDASPRLRIVANHAVGLDNVDLEACRARGIVVTNTPGVLTEATADLAFGLLVDAARRISEGDRLVRAGGWTGWTPTFLLGKSVHGARLGIVGMGRIGRAMAQRARGFSMDVRWSGPRDLPEPGRLPLDELLATSDFVSLHAPLLPSTRGLLDASRIRSMKRGAILINTARGALVDELALARALVDGHLAAAGLDVYVGEPAIDPALLSAPNVVLCPHLGSADHKTRAAMANLAVDSVLAFARGEEIPNRVA
ncbi:MAG: 2-hydroxyacid dehydrogenase [Polyangiales bacterium]